MVDERHERELVQTKTVTTETVAEEFVATESVSETVKENTTIAKNNQNNDLTVMMSPGEKIIFKMLLDIAADIKTLKSDAVDFKVYGYGSDTTCKIKRIDKTKLLEIGLPLKEPSGLGKFEYDLSTKEFRNKVVCHICCFCVNTQFLWLKLPNNVYLVLLL